MPLYHMDVYRLDGKVDDLGIEEYYKKVVFVLLSGLKLLLIIYLKNRLDIKFKIVDEEKKSYLYNSSWL